MRTFLGESLAGERLLADLACETGGGPDSVEGSDDPAQDEL